MQYRQESKPNFRIRDLNPTREWSLLAAFVAALGLGIAAGFWDLVILALFAYSFALADLARRCEWKGNLLSAITGGPSIVADGPRALPRDTLTLLIILVGFPASAVALVLIYGTGTFLSWLGLAVSTATSAVAGALLAIELRRRLIETPSHRHEQNEADQDQPPDHD